MELNCAGTAGEVAGLAVPKAFTYFVQFETSATSVISNSLTCTMAASTLYHIGSMRWILINSHLFDSEALGLSYDILAVAEKKATARRFISYNYPKKIGHVFHDNSAYMSDSGGFCDRHGKDCIIEGPPADISSGGFPCPPFSSQRNKTGGGPRSGPEHTHPLFDEVMVKFIAYLRRRRPGIFWLEEVLGFLRKLKILDYKSGVEVVAELCEAEGYACEALTIDHSVFITISRVRCFLIGVHEREGGRRAAQWIVRHISACVQHRAMALPTQWLSIVDITEAEHVARMNASQAIFSFLLFWCGDGSDGHI